MIRKNSEISFRLIIHKYLNKIDTKLFKSDI